MDTHIVPEDLKQAATLVVDAKISLDIAVENVEKAQAETLAKIEIRDRLAEQYALRREEFDSIIGRWRTQMASS